MKADLRKLEMPLLARELKELAWRRRTYIIRFVYAVVLFAVACVLFYGDLFGTASAGLGRGRVIFRMLILWQFWGIVILLPATTAGAVTLEKERDALGVLMLTTLGPFRIVLQKLLSRLIPMFSFLLLGMPLLAVAFSFGGVTDGLLWGGIEMLFLTCVQVGAVSILCSVWATSTPQALVQSWLCIFLLYFIAPQLWLPRMIDHVTQGTVHLAPSLLLSGIVLAVAAALLRTRAFVPPRNVLLEIFHVLDGFFNEANQLTGGVVLVRDENKTPRDLPVSWRETTRKSLGTFRYQFRVLACLEVPILFCCQMIRLEHDLRSGPTSMLLSVLWVVSLLLVLVHGASLVSSERSRQTLDVLLTTPMTGRSILIQKWHGLRRMVFLLFVPFLTIFLFEAWYFDHRDRLYLLWSTLSCLMLLPTVAWISIWIGLRTRSQIRAILTSLAAVSTAAVAPVGLRALMLARFPESLEAWGAYLTVMSPFEVVRSIEDGTHLSYGLPESPAWYYAAHFTVLASVGIGFRVACQRGIDSRLGRVPIGFRRPDGVKLPAVADQADAGGVPV